MSRRYYRRRSQDSNLTGGIVVVALIAIVVAHTELDKRTQVLLFASAVLVAILIIILVLYMHFRHASLERKKLQALSMVDIHIMDGLAFEKYVAELLRSQGYTNITLTEKYDYGVDIIAVKDGVRWGIQVKRHRHTVREDAVRQVIAGLNHYKCQRAMVVTNSNFTYRAKNTAKDNNCILVDRDTLAGWMVKFQAHQR